MRTSAAQRPGAHPGTEVALDSPELGRHQLERLRALLEETLPRNRFYGAKLAAAGLGPGDVRSLARLEDLRRLPFTTKAELEADQEAHPPYGSNLTYPLERYTRCHQTSGSRGRPIRWLDTLESWAELKAVWRTIFSAAGVTGGDRLLFAFSFGPFLGFWVAFEAANDLGFRVLPAGGMSSEARLRFLLENRATVVLSTPTYALRLAEAAEESGMDLRGAGVRALIVAGEPGGSIPAVRGRIEAAWGARCFDHWGMTEVGPLGFEPEAAPGGLSILETACIPEVIDPATGQPSAPGTRGELVITGLHRFASPVIRYRTGDLVAAGAPPKGAPAHLWLEGGVLGRADDMFLVKGNKVYPSAVEAVLRGLPRVAEYRVEVVRRSGGSSDLRLVVEPARGADAAEVMEEVRRAFQAALLFRPEVSPAAPGSLPRFEMKSHRIHFRESV